MRNAFFYGAAGILIGSLATIVAFVLELLVTNGRASTSLLGETAIFLMVGGAFVGGWYGKNTKKELGSDFSYHSESLTQKSSYLNFFRKLAYTQVRTEDGYKVFTVDFRKQVTFFIILLLVSSLSQYLLGEFSTVLSYLIIISYLVAAYPIGDAYLKAKIRKTVKKSNFVREYWYK